MDKLPTVSEYSKYLQIAIKKFGITIDEARSRYGLFTTSEWEKLLK
jgi:hypothetical protein